jgi:hypothetical protein
MEAEDLEAAAKAILQSYHLWNGAAKAPFFSRRKTLLKAAEDGVAESGVAESGVGAFTEFGEGQW